MPRRDDAVSLKHMLEHAQEALAFVHGRDRSALDQDRMLFFALRSLIEIVGEAATRVSSDAKSRLTEIPWGRSSELETA